MKNKKREDILKFVQKDAVYTAALALKVPKVADIWSPTANTRDFVEGFKEAQKQMMKLATTQLMEEYLLEEIATYF